MEDHLSKWFLLRPIDYSHILAYNMFIKEVLKLKLPILVVMSGMGSEVKDFVRHPTVLDAVASHQVDPGFCSWVGRALLFGICMFSL